MPIDNLDSNSDQITPQQFPSHTPRDERETASEAALRSYSSMGLTRKQDEPEPIPQDALQPVTNGGQPY